MQYLITGNTYVLRRQIKWFGWFWNKEHKGWVISEKNENIEKFILENGLELEELQEEVVKSERIDVLIDRAKNKISMYEKRWSKARKDFEDLEKRHNELTYGRDYAFITQPCNGHRGMINIKNKVDQVMEKKYWKWGAVDRENLAESKLEYWREELKRLEDKKSWKWKNAKQRTEDFIERTRPTLKVWDKYKTHYAVWICTIKKVNQKTVRFEETSWVVSIASFQYYTKID